MLESRNVFSYPLGLSILFSILLYIFFLAIDRILLVFDKRIFYKVLYLYLLSVFYIFIPVLINLFFTLSNSGLNIFLYQIVTCKIADSVALIVGKKYGRVKLAYSISPNKTVEGFIGSVISGFLFSIVFYFISTDFRKMNFLLHLFVGLIMSILNNIGDLFESFLKRINNVKDSSTILFGIGGVLDLIDGILPSTYLMLLYYDFIK